MKTEMDIDALIAIVLAIDCHSLRLLGPLLLPPPLLLLILLLGSGPAGGAEARLILSLAAESSFLLFPVAFACVLLDGSCARCALRQGSRPRNL